MQFPPQTSTLSFPTIKKHSKLFHCSFSHPVGIMHELGNATSFFRLNFINIYPASQSRKHLDRFVRASSCGLQCKEYNKTPSRDSKCFFLSSVVVAVVSQWLRTLMEYISRTNIRKIWFSLLAEHLNSWFSVFKRFVVSRHYLG